MNSVKAVQNPLLELQKLGQSVWLDYIRRDLISSGQLKKFIDEDGLRGITSNPAIFEKAIGGSTDYADVLAEAKKNGDTDAGAVYERLAIKDIQDSTDILKPVYESTKKRDGYVSLEVSPLLADDTEATLTEARRLWKAVNRPNVMIKVPATEAGIPAIKTLISEGININVTLLFFQKTYERVAEAFIEGLEQLEAKGGDVSSVASVASFFISRIDSLVDKKLEELTKSSKDEAEQKKAKSIMGKVAIANAKLTYAKYKELFSGDRWDKLAKKGAMTQRVLWASTSTKNPSFPDTIYVDELIGPDTVNTIPPATFDAFKDHGHAKATLETNLDDAKKTMDTLAELKLSMKELTDQLVLEGVKLFADAFHKLIDAVSDKIGAEKKKVADDNFAYKLPGDLSEKVQSTLKKWQAEDKVKKLWNKDASLWTNADEAKWLDWLNIVDEQKKQLSQFKSLAEEVKAEKYTHVLLLGMGGSSLCPEVLAMTFGKQSGFPELHVLDSVDPAQIQTREKQVDLAKTLFIVSSKSGSTLEPNIFKQYFYQRAVETVGKDNAGKHFIAITDPGSKMQKVAEQDKFKHIFYGLPGIGGRYSALSNFGMIPAAVMGLDMTKFLDKTEQMVKSCGADVPAEQNPGVVLGAIIGNCVNSGRDKLTLIASPGIHDIGAWLEQLLAESTGKQGKGVVPVDREKLADASHYGNDRLFAYLRLPSAPCPDQEKAVEALEKAGQPVVRINVGDIYSLGEEFFRWEIATAVAGSIIGINPFDQPDVEASKIATREITEAYEKNGSLPEYKALYEGEGIKLFTDEKNSADLNKAVGSNKSLEGYLKAHFDRIKAGDYFAELAYIEMNDEHEKALQVIRTAVRDKKKVATCLGFGPRFQHSTGQAYKGGPNSGVFLQVTCDDKKDLQVPDQKYTFGVVKEAQARGDFKVLADRNRRALRVHLGQDVAKGLQQLEQAALKALG